MTSDSTTWSVLPSGEVHGITSKVLEKGKEKCSFIWTIENFSIFLCGKTCGSWIESPTFPPSNRSKYQWQAHLYPFGEGVVKVLDPLVGLALYSPSVKKEFTIARCCLSLRDAKHCEFDRFVLDYKFDGEYQSHGVYQSHGAYQTLWSLHQKSLLKQIGVDDILEIQVEIFCVVQDVMGTYRKKNQFDNLIKPDKLVKDLSAMFRKQELTDVVITVQGTEIKAHRDILTARSPVLAKLFQCQKSVTINDMEPEIMRKLLLFTYSSSLEIQSITEVKKLIEAAETYGVEDLKDLCGEYLSDRVRSVDIVDTLDYADSHNMSLLKLKAIDFICRNRKDFTFVDTYRKLFKKPQLLAEIVVKMASN